MLQCRLFRHVVLDISHGLTYEKLDIRFPTYRQTEQRFHIQKPDSNGIATRWLHAALKLLLHRWLQLETKESGVASVPRNSCRCKLHRTAHNLRMSHSPHANVVSTTVIRGSNTELN
jgi:hypothetical protein